MVDFLSSAPKAPRAAQAAETPKENGRPGSLLELGALWATTPVAYLIHDDAVFYATAPTSSLTQPWRPHSAVTELIQGLYSLDPETALWRVRQRIWTQESTPPVAALNATMVALAARKIRILGSSHSMLENPECGPALQLATRFWRLEYAGRSNPKGLEPDHRSLEDLISQIPDGPVRARSARKVAAILYDSSGQRLWSAVSTNAFNRTQHAEVNLVQSYVATFDRPLPAGSIVVTSLKPCRMCATMLLHACEAPLSLRVRYRDFDPGPKARSTALNQGSPDRRRFFSEWPADTGDLETQVRD